MNALISLLTALLLSSELVNGRPFDSNVKVCNEIYLTYNELQSNFSLKNLSAAMYRTVDGCQYVNGDLTFNKFGVQNVDHKPLGGGFEKLETDFLDSIEEIAGRLVIEGIALETLTFRNLRVIRGYVTKETHADPNYALKIMQSMLPMRLRFPKLTAISRGDATVLGEVGLSTYCFLAQHVNWKLLFKSSWQKFVDNAPRSMSLDQCQENMTCSQECAVSGFHGTEHNLSCWSDGLLGCQSAQHRCHNKHCPTSCYRDAVTGVENWCHGNCLGGCSGEGPSNCNSCSDSNLSGVCRKSCRHLWQLEHLCLESCAPPYIHVNKHGDKMCLSECGDNEIPEMSSNPSHCRLCAPDCGKVCDAKGLMMTDSDAQDLLSRRCHLLRASQKSFIISGKTLKSAASLKTLENLRVFYGQKLSVGFIDQLNVTNFGSFRHLEHVSDTLSLYQSRVKYLGLASLRYVRRLTFTNLNGLCRAWYPTRRVNAMRRTMLIWIKNVTFDDTSEECKRATCDSSCGGGECWGPGPEMCVMNER